MKILEYLFDMPEFDGTGTYPLITDTSGQGNHGVIQSVISSVKPAQIVADQVPPGYRYKAVRYNIDEMIPSTPNTVEPDNQLQFIEVAITERMRDAINTSRALSISMWAYHEIRQDPIYVANPWDAPQTQGGRGIFCPQHVCIDRSLYTFVRASELVNPAENRGQLAFTGPGDSEVIGQGGIGQELGGTTSDTYHVPPNEWIHLAFTLQPPVGGARGIWKIYINGNQVAESPATAALASSELIPRTAEDIRFGNFRGNDRPDPLPSAPGANDYAFNGYLTAIRMYDNEQSATDIRRDISADINVISLAQVSRTRENQITVAFRYSNPVPEYTHALVLLVEQDAGKDRWQSISRAETVDGAVRNVIHFENESFPGGISTAGNEDDVGGTGSRRRRRLIRIQSGSRWTTTRYTIMPSQPDTDAGLEFYAVIAVVSVAGGKPVAQLGDLVITPTLAITV